MSESETGGGQVTGGDGSTAGSTDGSPLGLPPGSTLGSTIGELLSQPLFAARVAYGAGPQRSDVVRLIGYRWFRRSWPAALGRCPRLGESLTVQQRHVVATAPLGAAVETALELFGRLWEAVCAERDDSHASERLREAVASVVGSQFAVPDEHPADSTGWAVIAPLDDDAVRVLARQVLDRAREVVRPLSSDDFADLVAARYQRCWSTEGLVAAREWPPQEISLGSGGRPPLVWPRGRSETSWVMGTDRDLYSRYCLHFKASAHTAVPRNRRPDPRLTAYEEVGRACAGYGLSQVTHRRVLATLHAVPDTERARGVPRGAWKTWTSGDGAVVDDASTRPGGESAVDEQLLLAVREHFVWWYRSSAVATDLRAQGLLGDGVLDLVSWALVRKLWMGLHAEERERSAPVTRRRLASLVRAALDCGVREGLRAWGSDAVPPAHLQERRRNKAFALVAAMPEELVRGSLAAGDDGRHELVTHYGEHARRALGAHWTEMALTGEELLVELSAYGDGAGGDRDGG